MRRLKVINSIEMFECCSFRICAAIRQNKMQVKTHAKTRAKTQANDGRLKEGGEEAEARTKESTETSENGASISYDDTNKQNV